MFLSYALADLYLTSMYNVYYCTLYNVPTMFLYIVQC